MISLLLITNHVLISAQIARHSSCKIGHFKPKHKSLICSGLLTPLPEMDEESRRLVNECGLKPDITEDDIRTFCREMIEQNGNFAGEAAEILQKEEY